MIVKNEEEVLDNCLSSISDVVDEIIIVDTGSNDNTKIIANKYTNNIYDFKWCDDFSKARNYSFSKATKDYILWLDADDYLTLENKEKLLKLKNSLNNEIDMYYFLYDFNDNYQPFYRERLLKRSNNYQFKGKIHEAIIPFGKRSFVDVTINQKDKNKGLTNRNLKIFQKMNKDEFTARDYYYYARELFRHKKYNKSLVNLKKFLKCKDKYIEDEIDAYYLSSLIYAYQNDIKKAKEMLFYTFNLALPRPNILCELGNIYFNENNIESAIYYYKLALNTTKQKLNCFIHNDYLGFIPAIQLCICYDILKDYRKSYEYNELANTYKANNEFYQNNKNYLLSKLK